MLPSRHVSASVRVCAARSFSGFFAQQLLADESPEAAATHDNVGKKEKKPKTKVERTDGRSQIKGVCAGGERLFETCKAANDGAHVHRAELQSAPLRTAAALQPRRGPSVGARVRRGRAEPQSPAGLLPEGSEPDQREAAGKIRLCATESKSACVSAGAGRSRTHARTQICFFLICPLGFTWIARKCLIRRATNLG